MRRAPLLGLLVVPLACAVPSHAPPAPPVGIHYQLELVPDLDLLTFEGRSHVTFPNPTAGPLGQVPLHVFPNGGGGSSSEEGGRTIAIRSVTVQGKEIAPPPMTGAILMVSVDPPVAPGQGVDIDVAFSGVLPRMAAGESDLLAQSLGQIGDLLSGLLGAERSSSMDGDFGILAYGDGVLSFGNWYPQLPAYHAGSWALVDGSVIGDMSFAEIADYTLDVTVPADVRVAASGALASTKPAGNGRSTLRFEAHESRNVAVEMSRRFEVESRAVDGVTVSSYYLPGHATHGHIALETASDALAYYGGAFGPYPWTELDVVEAPLKGGAGGVEFTGLVTCSTGLYGDILGQMRPFLGLLGLVGMDGSKLANDLTQGIDEMLEFVVAHEVAHQWWNAAVGSNCRSAPFLDESLANFSAVRYFATKHGPEAARRQRELQLEMTYQMHRALGGADQAVDGPAGSFTSLVAYSAIVYGKGALFFEDLVDRFGEEPVLAAMSRYFARGRMRVMEPEDLKVELVAIDPAVDGLWSRWLSETHGDEDIGTGAIGEMMGAAGLDSLLGGLLGGDGSADQLLGQLLGGLNGSSTDGTASGLEELLGDALSEILQGLPEDAAPGEGTGTPPEP